MDSFKDIKSMSFSCPVSAFFPVDVSSEPNITVVNCLDYSISNFVTYIGSMHSLFINATTEYQWANTNLRYKSVDSWGNPYYSNWFWIYLDRGQPPAVTNTFGPLSINYGVSKLFEIPYDLFTSVANQSLQYNVNNWINIETKNTHFEIVSHNEYINSSNIVTQFFLSVISYDRFSVWNFPITAKSLMGGSSEYTTQLNMIVCSSKDWTDWTGPYQSDWIKCKDGFTLQSSGICLQTNNPFSFAGLDFYSILGLITWIIIVIQLIASFKLKHLSLLPISYSQTILIFLCSDENLNQNILSYISWIQWTKLNFGFIYSQTFQNILNCQAESVRFINARMYWQRSIQNYLIIFALILFILSMLFILKKFFINYDLICIILRKLSYIFLSSKSQGKLIFISVTPFLFSNIVNDFMHFEEHAILSILSIILLVLWIIYSLHNVWICRNKEAVLKASEISYNRKFCSSLVLSVLLSWMFLQTHALFYLFFASTIVLFYWVVIWIQLIQSHATDKEAIIENNVWLIMNLQLVMILLLILMMSRFDTFKIDSAIWLMITIFYSSSLILSVFFKIFI